MTISDHSAEQDSRWQAVVERDRAQDHRFWYSVKTTGVFCRPSCPSRRPNPRNVNFHSTVADAQAAGFRACLRCRPAEASSDQYLIDKVVAACRRIEAADQPPRLEDLAQDAALSPYHFHRVFKRVTGLTPRQYAAAHRTRRVQGGLSGKGSVTSVIYDAGFNSSSRFYEQASATLGMTPSAWKAGGKDANIRFAIGECSLGSILVAASDRGVCAILLGDDPAVLLTDFQDRFSRAELTGDDPAFDRLVATVIGFIEAPGQGLDLPLDVRGTAFQQRVWRALTEIRAGETANYSEIAKAIGAPAAVRAVASACAANVLAVAIPCHRVVRRDGALSGYRWGIERKRTLLARERMATA